MIPEQTATNLEEALACGAAHALTHKEVVEGVDPRLLPERRARQLLGSDWVRSRWSAGTPTNRSSSPRRPGRRCWRATPPI